MGQLEKYGLYVLCLVIFLILGVALWGDPAVAAASERAASAPASAAQPSYDLRDFKELMSQAGTPPGANDHGDAKASPQAAPASDRKVDAEPVAPPSAPEPAKADPKAARRTHVIVAGDTFEGIARQELGDARLVSLLRDLNPSIQPERMRQGKTLVLPSAAEVAAQRGGKEQALSTAGPKEPASGKGAAGQPKPDQPKTDQPKDGRPAAKAQPRTHTVVLGDTLEGLARHYYGSAKRVDDIKKLNPALDPTRMRVGQLIRLPD